MKQFVSSWMVVLAITLFSAAPAIAKGQTEKLTVSGPGITTPIELIDAEAISASAWGNDFFQFESGAVEAPALTLPRYEVRFHVRPPVGGPLQMKYAVYFVLDRSANRALVYLPSPDDPLYRLNSAMIREGQEGKWYLATEKWRQALERVLPPNFSR